ncbi:unnamed protein product [Tuber melanosporum]|uniref:(Perigord truffle) hypothetical protein n=1 Tax=Tuber melanosporum (strain Mel28) TaxID=656061 RepID=D5G9P4_TUBMM|nr:uncharacterized protein GSTUM_00005009001 [Tuber melanosporum]CAZ81237.1 unnamed protein product [Tuber melanosporum]
MVIFQNKIIYMPGIPIGAKREKIEAYQESCMGIDWHGRFRDIKTEDGRLLSWVEATVFSRAPAGFAGSRRNVIRIHAMAKINRVYRNASSTPPRLPLISAILSSLKTQNSSTTHTVIIPSYRGYWTSTGSPSQSGIEKDMKAIFRHLESYSTPGTEFILWGQSIGCGIALKGWANYLRAPKCRVPIHVKGLIMETPFISISSMLLALYPQRWLPYRYLSPFLRNHWDVREAVNEIAEKNVRVDIVALRAEKDELVTEAEAVEVEGILERILRKDRHIRRAVITGALHVECVAKAQGRGEIISFLKDTR